VRLPGRRRSAEPDADRVSLAKLQAVGANLGKPRRVVHELMFGEETAARSAAARVEGAGWDASLEPPSETAAHWTLRGEGTRVIDSTTVVAFRSLFEQVAEETGGTYLGWEAASKP
jgi:hypothetical protein